MSVLSAYEKMFEDGSAYKPIKLQQETPTITSAQKGEGGLGEVTTKVMEQDGDVEPDWSAVDAAMEARVNKVKRKISEAQDSGTVVTTPSDATLIKEIKALKGRVNLLEKALEMVMATQTKILEG